MAKFEVFESSSDDELSQGAYESAAISFQKHQERLEQQNTSDDEDLLHPNESVAEKERRLQEKERRQERKR